MALALPERAGQAPAYKRKIELKSAGVDFRLCGQAALGRKITQADMTPAVQLDLWALTTIISFQQQRYILIATVRVAGRHRYARRHLEWCASPVSPSASRSAGAGSTPDLYRSIELKPAGH